jgi:hypothetical protein
MEILDMDEEHQRVITDMETEDHLEILVTDAERQTKILGMAAEHHLETKAAEMEDSLIKGITESHEVDAVEEEADKSVPEITTNVKDLGNHPRLHSHLLLDQQSRPTQAMEHESI